MDDGRPRRSTVLRRQIFPGPPAFRGIGSRRSGFLACGSTNRARSNPFLRVLGSIVGFSLRHHGVVIGFACVLLAYGVFKLSNAGLDIFPEFSPKQVIIQTEARGLSAEQVEILVSHAVENSIAGLSGLKSTRSESIQGLSIVTAVFDDDTDIFKNRVQVSERIARLTGKLPEGAGPPVAVPLSSSSATVLTIGLQSEAFDLMELRSLAEQTVLPRLMAVPGVADVNVFGGRVRQLQIQLDPERLQYFDLGVNEVFAAAQNISGLRGTGFIENPNQRIALNITGQPASTEQIGDIVVARVDGTSVTLQDIATIRYAAEAPIGGAAILGKPGIVMMVIGQYGANTLTVSRDVEKALDELSATLSRQKIRIYSSLFRPADYIVTSVQKLSGHLLLGGAFVVLVLLGFLYNPRTAFISAVAIPLSLIGAALVLLEFGVNLNIMVLGGLAIALGEVVDDAIIDTENIFRRLRENKSLAEPRKNLQVVFEASMEVRTSVVYVSFIVALVFVPLLTLGGVTGRLFAPLAFAYILAILTSLLVALTVTPALCLRLLQNGSGSAAEPPLIAWLKPRFAKILEVVLPARKRTLFFIFALCLVSVAALPFFKAEFLPKLREGHYIVHTSSLPGTSLEESLRIGRQLTRAFLEIPGVVSVSQWAGRAERGADTFGSHYSEYEVRLEALSGHEQQQVLASLREILDEFPGILFEANTFLTERIDETISGYTAPVVINFYGDDLNRLDQIARQAYDLLEKIPGATDIQVQSPPGSPLLQIRIHNSALTQRGLRPAQVMDAIEIAYDGRKLGKIYQNNRAYDVVLIMDPEFREQPNQARRLPLKTLDGANLLLGEVAEISQTGGRYNILHHDGQRLQSVTTHVENRDLASFSRQVKREILDAIEFPTGFHVEFTGAAVEQAKARTGLIVHALLAGSLVLMLVYIAVSNLRLTAITLANLPFSMAGGIAAVWLTGSTLSVGSMVGFITLFGITVRNSIMLITHCQHLIEVEGRPWNSKTAILGAQQRLPSILMTALVTALAMLPIAINSDNPGREIMGPMASIIIGGLFSSTLLNLLLLPTVLLHYGRLRGKKI